MAVMRTGQRITGNNCLNFCCSRAMMAHNTHLFKLESFFVLISIVTRQMKNALWNWWHLHARIWSIKMVKVAQDSHLSPYELSHLVLHWVYPHLKGKQQFQWLRCSLALFSFCLWNRCHISIGYLSNYVTSIGQRMKFVLQMPWNLFYINHCQITFIVIQMQFC